MKNCKLIFSGTLEKIENYDDTLQCLKNVVHYLNIKIPDILVEIIDFKCSSSIKLDDV